MKIEIVNSPINNNPSLAQMMVWCWKSNYPLSELIMAWFTDEYMLHSTINISKLVIDETLFHLTYAADPANDIIRSTHMKLYNLLGDVNIWIHVDEQAVICVYLCMNVYTARKSDTLRLRQIGRHFADNIFKCISLNENTWISIEVKFVLKDPN